MKEITFRPLRRIKKTGKIVVASYMQWNKVRCADYSEFNLIVDNEYSLMPRDEYVHDSKGELLFWKNFNPADMPTIASNLVGEFKDIQREHDRFVIQYSSGNLYYIGNQIDCAGVPTFSHYNINYLATHIEVIEDWEPLTVGIVVDWFGWFLYQLQNTSLQIGKYI